MKWKFESCKLILCRSCLKAKCRISVGSFLQESWLLVLKEKERRVAKYLIWRLFPSGFDIHKEEIVREGPINFNLVVCHIVKKTKEKYH